MINPFSVQSNYSWADISRDDQTIKLNVHSVSPIYRKHSAGVSSAYVFHLKAGDKVSFTGLWDDFHLKSTSREIVFLTAGS